MYAKVKNDKITSYPVDPSRLHPQVIFPAGWEGGVIEGEHYVAVKRVESPTVSYMQNLVEKTPEKNDSGVWVQAWLIAGASPQEVEARIAAKWADVRRERNSLLAGCDWTQLGDSPLSTAEKGKWKTYRKALRDITEQVDPFEIVWPSLPA
jgi:hypothetical protein